MFTDILQNNFIPNVTVVKFQHWQLQQNTRNDPLQSLKILISENV
jgi:hypothetical protein